MAPTSIPNSRDSGDAGAFHRCARNCGPDVLGWKKQQVVSDLQLHAVDLGQEPGSRCAVVDRVGLGPAELSHLLLEPGNAFQGRLQFLVVGDHDPSPTISTMLRRPPSRRACQYSIIACSPPSAP